MIVLVLILNVVKNTALASFIAIQIANMIQPVTLALNATKKSVASPALIKKGAAVKNNIAKL